jgi:hypothetical protein
LLFCVVRSLRKAVARSIVFGITASRCAIRRWSHCPLPAPSTTYYARPHTHPHHTSAAPLAHYINNKTRFRPD